MNDIVEAAGRILDKCFTLGPDKPILLVFDDTTREVAGGIIEATQARGMVPLPFFFPVRLQTRYSLPDSLPGPVMRLVDLAAGALTPLSNGTGSTGFRIQFANACLRAGKPLAHMPGITPGIFALQAAADYDLIFSRAEDLMARLHGEVIEIQTRTQRNERRTLFVEIKGRVARKCGCRLAGGDISNIPCGEAFIAPVESSAEGAIVINGSIPGFLVPPHAELELEFSSGRLVSIRPQESVCGRELARIAQEAKERRDLAWDVLAEVGVGTNDTIRKLTGIPAVDEKAAGTIHVAIGENSEIGGRNSSTFHLDMVTRPEAVLVDGTPLPIGSSSCIQDGGR